ncbi:lipopolysaccharide kinase InaA family protein [Fuchsiella alkaliacetigena]|uniref:lipopolysaccharide kinase InaA family protein n=1 Tax=Fuchsiella alkaliacetigena TaxID=957042 RepID=UPI00200A1D30|nr:lipopolysaccharide kinase InaA family protein [Fuchsiella alkaliacetigena]MCK8824302.1 hypothetical protein [Fuchsiella alkaliacetigena]
MEFNKEKYTSKIKIYYNTPDFKGLSQRAIDYFWLDKDFLEENIELIKDGTSRKIRVFKLNYDNKTYYLKKYAFERIDKKLQNNLFRRPEGIRNMKNAHKLLAAGIPTAKPIFSATKRKLLCRDSIFVSEEAPGIELAEYINENGLSGQQRLIKALAGFWGRFIGNNFIHQDPGLDNLFVNLDEDKFELTLIDIDSVYALPFLPKIVALHTLARIVSKLHKKLFKLEHHPLTKREQDLFLQEFIANCSKDFDFEKLNYKLNKLIVKKMIKKDRRNIVAANEKLSAFL